MHSVSQKSVIFIVVNIFAEKGGIAMYTAWQISRTSQMARCITFAVARIRV